MNFSSTNPLQILYKSSTKPLPILYLSSTLPLPPVSFVGNG